MGYRVVVQPSGHEFRAESQETLLEAALRSGININYNCSSGSCGDCKARVLEGLSEDRAFHDYRLSDSERARGVILLCTSHAASDLVIEAQEAHGAADIPLQQISTKVAKIERLNEHIFTVVLRTPRSQTLRFLAGQHVALHTAGLSVDLPISSCPCNGMMLQFHLRLGSDEPFASHLLGQTNHAAAIEVEGPFGDFVLDDDSTRPMVMIAEDTGFAPIKGLIEHAINLEKPQPLHLYRFANDSSGLYMENYCESWREALDDYAYTGQLLAATDNLAEVLMRRLGSDPVAAQSDFYIAVAPESVAALEAQLLAFGIAPARLRIHQHRRAARASQWLGQA